MNRKLFAIGDIHGCFDKLTTLMDRIEIDQERDTLVFMGDYIDRGPKSFQVVSYLLELKKRCPGAVFLKGNHEEMLEDYLAGREKLMFLSNGGRQTLQSYHEHGYQSLNDPIPPDHLAFFRNLLLYYETENFIFVHAGLAEEISLEKQQPQDLLWIRGRFVNSRYNWGKQVVFGHTPFPEPMIAPNKIGIDTGATYGHKLSCIELTQMKIISV